VRILVLSAQYPRGDNPTSGVFVQEQVAALRRAGVDARILVGVESWLGPSRPLFSADALARFFFRPPCLHWRQQAGAIYAEFPTVVLGRLGGAMRSVSYTIGLERVLNLLRREFPFALVHAHTALLDGAAACKIKSEFGVPVILTEHTGPFSVITRTPAMRRRVRLALQTADRVVAVSATLVAMIREVFPELGRSLEIIPNGVDERLFRPATNARPVSDRRTILWVGSLNDLKRPLLALAAFAEFATQRSDFDLQMIGWGPLEKPLRREVERLNLATRVRIDGHHDRSMLASAMSAAAVLLVTSTVETFSLVTAEALSSGVPVVSTRCGGPEEIIVEPWLGRISDPSPEALSAALLDVTASVTCFPPGRLRAYAVDRFGMDVVSSRYLALYEQLLARPG
jgi:glycosyltransferase involved in cell wall biosynthesis